MTKPPPPPSPPSKSFVANVKAIRERARQKVEEGAATSNYSIDPKAVCALLNGALAPELVCVLRYKRHYFTALCVLLLIAVSACNGTHDLPGRN